MQMKDDNYLRNFPNIVLPKENIINTNKSFKSDIILAIPEGSKQFLWFTNQNNKNICLLLDPNNLQKQTVMTCCYSDSICYGTILYGTYMKHLENNFFTVEDIFFYKGENICNCQYDKKLDYIRLLFENDIKQIAYNNRFLLVGMPILSNDIEEIHTMTKSVNYKIESIKYIQFKNNVIIKCVKNPTNIPSNKSAELPSQPRQERKQKPDNKIKQLVVFKVRPSLNDDIYMLYCMNNGIEEFVSNALIPDYKTSVMMNGLFRNIKENVNLDAIEESDDEEDFENDCIDKYVNLGATHNVECMYNRRFNKWIPLRVVNKNMEIVEKNKISC